MRNFKLRLIIFRAEYHSYFALLQEQLFKDIEAGDGSKVAFVNGWRNIGVVGVLLFFRVVHVLGG